MAKVCPLFSGSKGNATYIASKQGAILIDVGASYKALNEAASLVGGLDFVRAVAVTHEHTDHICGLSLFLKKHNIPLIASQKTLGALEQIGKIPEGVKTIVAKNETIDICGMGIRRFATSHDCEGSSGYNIFLPEGKKITVCTDLGVVTPQVREAISGSNLILLESNHDIEMLKKGPYPPELKVRILSDKGHISNIACAAELGALLKSGTTRFILGHLSENNNIPMLAMKTAESALVDMGAKRDIDYRLTVAAPKGNGVSVI